MLILRGILGGLAQVALIAALLVIPAGLVAGEWLWPRAWQFIGVYSAALLIAIVFFAWRAPASLAARLRPPATAAQPLADKLATFALLASMGLFFVFIPLDVFSWQILAPTSGPVSMFGAVLAALGFGVVIWVFWENRFAIPVVEDQSQNGQRLVDTGPYAVVRHPFYAGNKLFMVGICLFLGSWASVPMILLVIAMNAVRIRIEERMLVGTLDGYEDYRRRCRFRMIPGVW